MNQQHTKPQTREALEAEYEAWLEEQHLTQEPGDAMDLIHSDTPTPTQRMWLTDFIHRWDAMEEADNG